MKNIISYYTSLSPHSLLIQRTAKGKPFLNEIQNVLGVSFNITHTQDLFIGVFTLKRRIGVDVESAQRCISTKLVNRYFTLEEKREIAHQDSLAQNHHKLRIWTAKEAVMKALGSGIFGKTLDCTITCPYPDQVLLTKLKKEEASDFRLYSFPLPGYVCTLAIDSPLEYSFTQFDFNTYLDSHGHYNA